MPNNMYRLDVPTKRGVVLNGVLFRPQRERLADTAYDWQFSGLLNNVHTAKDGDFSQAEKLTHNGALLVPEGAPPEPERQRRLR